MKNRFTLQSIILILFTIFWVANDAFSQEEIFTSDEGTEVPVKFQSLDPDDIYRLNVHIGPSYQAGKLYLGGVSYELPGKLFVHAQFGTTFNIDENSQDYIGLGTSIEANYFFSKKKPYTLKYLLLREYGEDGKIHNLMMEKEAEKRISHGIHLGFINAGIQVPQTLTYNTYVIGYSRLSVKQVQFLYSKLKIKKSIQTFHRINADLLIHRNIKSYGSSRQLIDNDFPTYGARLYYDGYIPLKVPSGGTRSTLYFTFGAESLVDPNDDWNIGIIFGVGYGRRFL